MASEQELKPHVFHQVTGSASFAVCVASQRTAFAALACPFKILGASPFTLYEKLGGGVARILLPHLHFHGSCTTIAHPKNSSQELVKTS